MQLTLTFLQSQGTAAASSSVNLPETIPETQGAGHYTPLQTQNVQSSSVNLPETVPETPGAGFYVPLPE